MMDVIDQKILSLLKKNSRMNASAIGAKVNMSVSAVIERIRKLENSGIIKRYTVLVDTKRMGKDVLAFISVGIEHPKYNKNFTDFVKQNSQIVECHYITGDSDFLIKVNTDSTQSLEQLLNVIKSVVGVSQTRTLVVLSTVKYDYSNDTDEI